MYLRMLPNAQLILRIVSRLWIDELTESRERTHMCAKFVMISIEIYIAENREINKDEKCRTAYAIFSQVWRTSRHNRHAKCDTSDHPSVSILMVIDQSKLCAIFQLEVFILKMESCHINY